MERVALGECVLSVVMGYEFLEHVSFRLYVRQGSRQEACDVAFTLIFDLKVFMMVPQPVDDRTEVETRIKLK
jgi:hypothetical protein